MEEWKKKDPITRLRKVLEKDGVKAEELDKLEQDAADAIAKAVEFALNSPEPDPNTVLDGVFYEEADA